MATPHHTADPVDLSARERKAALRVDRTGARAARSSAERVLAGDRLAGWAGGLDGPVLVAGFVGVGAEVPTRPLLDRLAAAGSRVLLPVVRPGGGLDWAADDGRLVAGALGLTEPAGPRLGPSAVREADLVLVPALAVDRAGHRLGRGAGYYDRVLADLPRTARVVAVVFDDDVVDDVPVEPHDQPVHAALTPSGLVRFR